MNTKTITEKSDSTRKDIYARITDSIVAALERGVRPWVKPWNAEYAAGRITRPLRHNGEAYAGINVISLWASAMAQNFSAPTWMTYRQAAELGGQVRKGEKGSPVVYASSIKRTESDKQGDDAAHEIHFLKGYTVFNVEQIDGLPEKYRELSSPQLDPVERIAHAEEFFAATGARVTHAGSRAFYRAATDEIVMPPFEVFRDAESYYATLAHETTHWTGHPSRLDRNFGSKRFGSEGYAMEELVAELGAAFICADLGMACEEREDHAAYIANWVKVLKNDNRAIFAAAGFAERAALSMESPPVSDV